MWHIHDRMAYCLVQEAKFTCSWISISDLSFWNFMHLRTLECFQTHSLHEHFFARYITQNLIFFHSISMLMPFLCRWKMVFNYISLIVWHLDKCKLIWEHTTYSRMKMSSFRGKWRRCNILLSILMPLFAFRLMPSFACRFNWTFSHCALLWFSIGCSIYHDSSCKYTKCQHFFFFWSVRPFCSQAYRFGALWVVLFSIASLSPRRVITRQ